MTNTVNPLGRDPESLPVTKQTLHFARGVFPAVQSPHQHSEAHLPSSGPELTGDCSKGSPLQGQAAQLDSVGDGWLPPPETPLKAAIQPLMRRGRRTVYRALSEGRLVDESLWRLLQNRPEARLDVSLLCESQPESHSHSPDGRPGSYRPSPGTPLQGWPLLFCLLLAQTLSKMLTP